MSQLKTIRIKYLIYLLFLSSFSAKAQEITYKPGVNKLLMSMRFSIADTTNNQIFMLHPEVTQISTPFACSNPPIIWIRDNPKDNSFYDMTFKGDSLDIKNKYGRIHFTSPKVSLDQLLGNQKFNFPTHWAIGQTIYKDSVIYLIKYNTGERSDVVANGMAARLNGAYEDLGKEISKKLRETGISNLADSVIVLQGRIEKGVNRPLEDLKLIVGKQSIFSDIALQIFGDRKNTWYPATFFSGVTGESIIKFYIKLDSSGAVSILPSKYMDAVFR
ncbi:hypothetical protein [Sphingobacterium sp.]|uniref:hypothetical protein n=1 Tax=Sphingobacterium sp. TaxID=341027 RepID=UPI00289634D8|nr:hypothetical protein [Sphingobacterium sp.]